MSSPFLGEIRIVGFPFAPQGYAQCQGQRVPISQNAALFSLIGVYYGGDGQTDFALPDLRGRAPMGIGRARGRPAVELGEAAAAGTPPGEADAELQYGLGLNFVIAVEGAFPSRN